VVVMAGRRQGTLGVVEFGVMVGCQLPATTV
jgi:hypothetical protein